MSKTTNNKPKHRVKEIFHELVGHTPTLLSSFTEVYGLNRATVNNIYQGYTKTISLDFAQLVVQFANQNRNPKIDEYSLKDLYSSNDSSSVAAKIKLS